MSVHICTNGVLIDRERALLLRDSGVSTVSISLESPDQETHDYLRGANTFPAVVDAIKLLRDNAPKIRIGINYLITRRNYRNMTEMVAFAESLGVHQLKFAPIHTNLLHRHKAKDEYDDLLFREEDLADLEKEVNRARKACAASSLTTTSDAFFSGIVQLYRKPKRFRCYAGYAVCAISASGDVSPCCDKDSGFNVREHTLDAIWRDPEFHKLRKQVYRCTADCWDTTNTELSLRLRPMALVGDFSRNWHDLRYYFGKRQD
jgi:MoaA/NifB/PqqE/SkfB family radical SAM enzyme